MADIAAFVTGTPIMHNNGPTFTFTASGAIAAGQVVAIDATGVSDTVRAAVAARVGEFAAPAHVRWTDEPLPRTATGKIRKRELRSGFTAPA